MEFGGISRSLIDIGRNIIFIEFSRNLRLVDLSGFPIFWFRVRVVGYKALLLIIGGSK